MIGWRTFGDAYGTHTNTGVTYGGLITMGLEWIKRGGQFEFKETKKLHPQFLHYHIHTQHTQSQFYASKLQRHFFSSVFNNESPCWEDRREKSPYFLSYMSTSPHSQTILFPKPSGIYRYSKLFSLPNSIEAHSYLGCTHSLLYWVGFDCSSYGQLDCLFQKVTSVSMELLAYYE